MLRILLLVAISLCGLPSRSVAQLHVGVSLGGRIAVHGQVGPRIFSGGPHRGSVHVVTCAPVPCYRTITERVWIPGYWETINVPAQYEWHRDECGGLYRVLVQPAYCERVWHPGCWRTEQRRVLVDG